VPLVPPTWEAEVGGLSPGVQGQSGLPPTWEAEVGGLSPGVQGQSGQYSESCLKKHHPTLAHSRGLHLKCPQGSYVGGLDPGTAVLRVDALGK
jgi:hypothetical protein